MDAESEFLPLFLQHQGELLGYILTMGVSPSKAEDVLQEASMILMKKFSEFEKGTNFRAWAYAVVRFEILREKRARARYGMRFAEATMEQLHEVANEDEEDSLRLDGLTHCMQKLNEKSRDMILMRYSDRYQLEDIALALKRPVDSIYTTMSRIRKKLQECIERFEREGLGAS